MTLLAEPDWEDGWLDPRPMHLRSGTDWNVEEEADRLLAADRRSCASSRADYLSREQLALRQSREVTNTNGVPDAALYVGFYRRAFNPLLGQRPGKRRTGDD